MIPTTPEPKVIEKIQKLLRLASSTNQHEAALAASRAAELMLEHQLTEAKIAVLGGDGPQEAISETDIASVGSKVVHWKGLIVRGLCDAFGTSFFWSWYTKPNPKDPWKTTRTVNVRIVGRATETQTVSYMFAYLAKEVDRLADEAYNPEQDENRIFMAVNVASRKWKESFRLGASQEICSRLQEQRAKTFDVARAAGESQALARIDQSRDAIVARFDTCRACKDAPNC